MNHLLATAVAVTATAMVTAAVVGSVVHTRPAGCTTLAVNGFGYRQRGPTWSQLISDGSTTYIVVNPPR